LLNYPTKKKGPEGFSDWRGGPREKTTGEGGLDCRAVKQAFLPGGIPPVTKPLPLEGKKKSYGGEKRRGLTVETTSPPGI